MRASFGICLVAVAVLSACGNSNDEKGQGFEDAASQDSEGPVDVDSVPSEADSDLSGQEELMAPEEEIDTPPDSDTSDIFELSDGDILVALNVRIDVTPHSEEDFAATYDTVKFQLFQGDHLCTEFSAVSLDTAVPLKEMAVSSIETTPYFGGVPVTGMYTALVRVFRNEGGQARVVAWGCTDEVVATSEAMASGTLGVKVPLQMVVLEVAGSYDYFEEYALDEAFVAAALSPLVATVQNAVVNPGTIFLGFLDAQLLPSLVGVDDAAYVAFQKELEDAVSAQLQQASPLPPVDLNSVVKALVHPRLEGSLELEQEEADVTAHGTLQRVILTWDFNGEPQVWTHPVQIPPGEGDEGSGWTGMTADVTQLVTDQSAFGLNLGSLCGEFLASSVLPLVMGVPTLADYLEALFDCTAIASAVSSEALAGIGLAPGDLLDACTATLEQIAQETEVLMQTASVPATLERSMTGTLLEAFGDAEDEDLEVEKILGVLSGVVDIGPDDGPLSGTFGASRVPPAN